MYCVDLSENALFSSYGVICVQPLPSTLPGELSMERMNISGLFSRYEVCSFSDSCYNSSLVTVDYQLSFLAILCTRSADLACMHVVLIRNQFQCLCALLWLLSTTLLRTVLLAELANNIMWLAIATQYSTVNISAFRACANHTAPRVWHQWCSFWVCNSSALY
jgi:hypothetical protein